MKNKSLSLVLAGLLCLVLCLGLNRVETLADTATGQGPAETFTSDDITITMSTDKAEYRSGEVIYYSIKIDNDKRHWFIAKGEFEYTNTAGLDPVNADSMPVEYIKLNGGESQLIEGMLLGNPNAFPPTEDDSIGQGQESASNESADEASGSAAGASVDIGLIIAIVTGLVFIVLILIIIKRRKGPKKDTGVKRIISLFLAAVLGLGLLPAGTAAAEEAFETVKLRPYIKVLYAGQEVTIRAVFEFHVYPERVLIDSMNKNIPTAITCHDPSIFKDTDGSYYIFGTHMGAGRTTDLRNWDNLMGPFRQSFTAETKDKIRAWNKDQKTKNWYDYLWAPDVVYNPTMGKYCFYLSANGDDWKSNIVLLTSDKVEGPYEYAGSVVYGGFTPEDVGETDLLEALGVTELPERYITNGIANKKWGDKWPNCIDPCVFYDDEGRLWISYGSWSGGIFMLELDETTGLRDYSVTYPSNEHSDAYFGTKIAGGWYVSGEGSYIQKIGDYYWLFMSYGALEAKGGYNVRVFRSTRPDGDYVDIKGNSALYDSYVKNFNQSVGVRLFGGYKWRSFNVGQVAQGHNSALVDDDGRAYIVYHTRTTDGSEGHTVKVHQLFLNEQGWLVAAPYITDGEVLPAANSTEDYVGEYEIILHEINIDYEHLGVSMVKFISLNADGTVNGDYEGSWSLKDKSPYINITIGGDTYRGLALTMKVENTKLDTRVFTAVGEKNQLTLWGSKVLDQ